VERLTNDITSFVKSTETFKKIIGAQKSMLDKTGISFNISKTQKMYKNFFLPKPDKNALFIENMVILKITIFIRKRKQMIIENLSILR